MMICAAQVTQGGSPAVVALDDDEGVVLVESYVDGVAVGLGDLDLPGGAVLGVTLDRVRGAAVGHLQRGVGGLVGLRCR